MAVRCGRLDKVEVALATVPSDTSEAQEVQEVGYNEVCSQNM